MNKKELATFGLALFSIALALIAIWLSLEQGREIAEMKGLTEEIHEIVTPTDEMPMFFMLVMIVIVIAFSLIFMYYGKQQAFK